MDLLTTASAADVAFTLTKNLPFSLSGSALKLYRVLVEAAVTVSEARGYSPATTEVVLFAPAEAVALDAGIHPATLYRALPELRAAGVVDARGHYTTHRGQTKQDGTLFAVRITPRRGPRARVGYSDLKGRYRDLGGDIQRGRTAWALLRESKDTARAEAPSARRTLSWALPRTDPNPVTSDSRMGARRDLERVLDVRFAPKGDRAEVVDGAARAISAALRDSGGTNFFRLILWNALRIHDRGPGGADSILYWIYEQVGRAQTDAAEGFARSPGALFTSRLVSAPWYDGLRHAPPVRVGPPPITA
jgi:hypothetical protein